MKVIVGGGVARTLLDHAEIHGVLVTANCHGTNEYDPQRHLITLSLPVHYMATIESAAIAAHEVGHAQQHATHYWPFQIRMRLFATARRLSIILPIAILASFVIRHSSFVIWLGLAYAGVAAFHLLVLPIELNASHRGVLLLLNAGVIAEEEAPAVRKILRRCAWTYALAFLTAPLALFRISRTAPPQ